LLPVWYAVTVNKKRNMPNMAYRQRKPDTPRPPMIDIRGHTVREGNEVMLLQSSIKHARYIVDEINGHIAYLRPRTNSSVQPFPVLSDQIVKVKRSQVQA
jgi:hypothetical protein